MWLNHHYTIAQVAQRWQCSEEIVQALVANGTIPTHRAFLGMFGPVYLDGKYVDLVAPDVRALNQRIDARMGGPGWQERKKQEREQGEQEIKRMKAHTEEIRRAGERQQQVFQQQLSKLMENHMQRLSQQLSEGGESGTQEKPKPEE